MVAGDGELGGCLSLTEALRMCLEGCWGVDEVVVKVEVECVGGSPKMKSLMKAAMRRTIESWPRTKP